MRTVLIALLLVATPALAQTLTFRDLAFMSGCWTTAKDAAEDYRECFTAPYAGMIQGSSQLAKDGKTTSFEFSVIAEKDGKITYAPFFNGKAMSVFTLTAQDKTSAVFENPANDFPKKVIYRKNADGSLTARIEGANADPARHQEWVMRPQEMR